LVKSVAKKLNLQFIMLYLRYIWERGLVEKSHLEGGEGPSYVGRRSKIAKTVIDI